MKNMGKATLIGGAGADKLTSGASRAPTDKGADAEFEILLTGVTTLTATNLPL